MKREKEIDIFEVAEKYEAVEKKLREIFLIERFSGFELKTHEVHLRKYDLDSFFFDDGNIHCMLTEYYTKNGVWVRNDYDPSQMHIRFEEFNNPVSYFIEKYKKEIEEKRLESAILKQKELDSVKERELKLLAELNAKYPDL
jgi:hypothetical protein